MKKIFGLLIILTTIFLGCRGTTTDDTAYSVDTATESAQQVGDAMASVDESGGSTGGAITSNEIKSYEKAFARINPNENSSQILSAQKKVNLFLPQAQATACNTIAFDTCGTTAANTKVRTLSSCTTAGNGTMSGNVTLTFTGTGAGTCTIPANTDSVSRVPNYAISGLRGATFTVSAATSGQTLTRTAVSTMSLSNAGIKRTFTTPKGTKLLDITTATGTPLTINGNARTGRTISAGTLVVTNNLTNVTCTLTPAGIAWTGSCNCPTAGTWSATCSDASTYSVAYGSTCGETTFTKASVATPMTMDRCQ